MKTSDKILLSILATALVVSSGVFITALSTGFISQKDAREIALKTVPGNIEESEVENSGYEFDISSEEGQKEVQIDSQGNVVSVSDEEPDVEITGTALQKASQAALNYLGEGRVTDTEIGDEEGYYEIEVTLENGKEVDVHLDKNFKVISVEN